MRKEDILYEQEYGHIPDDQQGRVTYILGKRAESEKYQEMIATEIRKFKRIKTSKVSFTMWKVVRPSARPRANSRGGYIHMYVPHAREAGDWFEDFAKENNLPFIETPCTLNIRVYEKTPNSFSTKNKVLAELGFIRPWKRTGDFDNYAKTIADCIQHGMLKDDCLIVSSSQELYYSIKPHVDVELIYMNTFPEY